jgi:hypothetical protein
MMMNEISTVTLRSLHGEPLEDESVRDMVIANALAIAERHGIDVVDIDTTATSITTTLRTGRIQAMGFAAELRRMTNNWYRHKFGETTLWGEPDDAD